MACRALASPHVLACSRAGRQDGICDDKGNDLLVVLSEEPRLWELCRDLDSLGGEACVPLLDFHSSSVLDFSPFSTWAAEMLQGRVCVQGAEGSSEAGKP